MLIYNNRQPVRDSVGSNVSDKKINVHLAFSFSLKVYQTHRKCPRNHCAKTFKPTLFSVSTALKQTILPRYIQYCIFLYQNSKRI